MKKAIAVVAWSFFALDAAAVLLCLVWVAVASTREGEQAYAIAFALVLGLLLTIAGGGLWAATRRRSTVGVALAGAVLAIPGLIVLGIWIANLLGM
jgi:hypothetical protein